MISARNPMKDRVAIAGAATTGFQPRNTESAPRRLAQNGAGEARPETIGPSREVVALRDGVQRRINPDEHHVEPVTQQIGQRGTRL